MKLSRSIQEESFCLDLVRNGNLIAGQTSSNFIKLFDTSSLSTITTLDAQDLCPPEPVSNPQRDQGTIKAIEWIDEQTLICAVDSSLGAIAAFDLRTGQVSQMFEVDRPVLSLSINKGKTLLVAGSEQRFTKSGNEAAMMFYDLRNASSLISKFEVHSDDVTCLEFNPYHSNQLISGSTDGLTLPSKKQNDALLYTLPEGSIYKLGFFGPSAEYMYSLTHIEQFSLHRFHDAELVASYGDIRNTSNKNLQLEYALDCHYQDDQQRLILMAGDRTGGISLLNVDLDGLSLSTKTVASAGSHTSTVRAASLNSLNGDSMISCSEDGTLNLWK